MEVHCQGNRQNTSNWNQFYFRQEENGTTMPTHYDGTPEERRALDVFIKLMRAAQSVADRTSGPMTEAGLTWSQFGVMETLFHLGPLMSSVLAEKHLKSPNNFTVVIDNLEKQGLVRRERDTVDRRVVRVHLTEAGREKIARALPAHAREVAADLQVLTPAEQEQLGALLRRLGKREKRA
jgi:MarR family 2-MHQ and catechol resistance regulon transcriptional repressor